jgi:hypothetical protein
MSALSAVALAGTAVAGARGAQFNKGTKVTARRTGATARAKFVGSKVRDRYVMMGIGRPMHVHMRDMSLAASTRLRIV